MQLPAATTVGVLALGVVRLAAVAAGARLALGGLEEVVDGLLEDALLRASGLLVPVGTEVGLVGHGATSSQFYRHDCRNRTSTFALIFNVIPE